MANPAQKKATVKYRTRLAERGIVRFEVTAPDGDRALIRALAKRLSEQGQEAEDARAAIARVVITEPPKPGGILAALRRSPLVGADIDLSRPHEDGRTVDI